MSIFDRIKWDNPLSILLLPFLLAYGLIYITIVKIWMIPSLLFYEFYTKDKEPNPFLDKPKDDEDK